MAIAGSHETGTYLKTSSWGHFKNRCLWLIALAALGLVSGYIVQSYEGLLLQFAVLATFMPMLADTGGNSGSQSATLVVRALAVREVSTGDILKLLWKEFKVGVPLALHLSLGQCHQFRNIVAIPSEVYPYLKAGPTAWPLTWVVIVGTLPGVFTGYYLRVLYLPDPKALPLPSDFLPAGNCGIIITMVCLNRGGFGLVKCQPNHGSLGRPERKTYLKS
ncbi:MAG: magnesium transporter [Deltaproteobacteria bacterium]|nr:magnesium transporter [Deltaproteobacteria bacterium]